MPISLDRFLGGRLQLRQPVEGHRAGTDAILLAAAAPQDLDGLALDIGAGVGAAGLALAVLRPGITIGLIENDPATAALARENLALNGLAERGHVYEADLLDFASLERAGLAAASARLVITNPPHFDPARVRLPQSEAKRSAYAMPFSGTDPLARWIAASMALLEEGGLFLMIHRPDALTELLASVTSSAGALTLLPIQARSEAPAHRILLRAKKGSRAPLKIAPALVLHDAQGFQAQIEKVNRGEALINW
ncbi:MAG TPA: methyltransferase [Methylovirgula sp.]|nr:methyltransferase [Methylovirgula sp.]